MKEEKEVQTAREIWNLLNRLNDLLFDQYEEGFFQLWLEEGDEQNPFLQPVGGPDIKRQEKMETAGESPNSH